MGQLVTITNPSSNFNPPPVKHYEAYRPKPFTRAERETTTLLFGGLTWKHERIMQGAMHNLKHNAEPLPNIARAISRVLRDGSRRPWPEGLSHVPVSAGQTGSG